MYLTPAIPTNLIRQTVARAALMAVRNPHTCCPECGGKLRSEITLRGYAIACESCGAAVASMDSPLTTPSIHHPELQQ